MPNFKSVALTNSSINSEQTKNKKLLSFNIRAGLGLVNQFYGTVKNYFYECFNNLVENSGLFENLFPKLPYNTKERLSLLI